MMEKVVIQETDRDILKVLTLALKMKGFEIFAVTECDNDFLNLIDRVRPHVVLLDYEFNGDTCIEICRQIKRKYPHLPVIALSCNVNIHEEYDKKGFDDYIRKPFELNTLYSILRFHITKPR